MNNRIEQITGQVLDQVVPETWTTLGYDKIKEIQYRTVEAVVKECADEILKWRSEPFPLDPEFAANIIKQHFGVK